MKEIKLVVRLANAADDARLLEENGLAKLLDETQAELEAALALIEELRTPEAAQFMARHSTPADIVDDDERNVLRHTLTGSSGTNKVYRNYFAASPGHADMPTIERLVLRGLMYMGAEIPAQSGRYYHCTEKGAHAVGLKVQEPWATQE